MLTSSPASSSTTSRPKATISPSAEPPGDGGTRLDGCTRCRRHPHAIRGALAEEGFSRYQRRLASSAMFEPCSWSSSQPPRWSSRRPLLGIPLSEVKASERRLLADGLDPNLGQTTNRGEAPPSRPLDRPPGCRVPQLRRRDTYNPFLLPCLLGQRRGAHLPLRARVKRRQVRRCLRRPRLAGTTPPNCHPAIPRASKCQRGGWFVRSTCQNRLESRGPLMTDRYDAFGFTHRPTPAIARV